MIHSITITIIEKRVKKKDHKTLLIVFLLKVIVYNSDLFLSEVNSEANLSNSKIHLNLVDSRYNELGLDMLPCTTVGRIGV